MKTTFDTKTAIAKKVESIAAAVNDFPGVIICTNLRSGIAGILTLSTLSGFKY